MKLTTTTFAILLLLSSPMLHSQVSVGYFPFRSLLSVTSDSEDLFFADLKLETNTFVSNLNMELSPKWNFSRSERVNYYAGVGIAFNIAYAFSDLTVINGAFLDFGARIKPFPKTRNFQVVFEISPYANKEFSGGNLRTRLGLAWNFTDAEAE